MNVPGKYLLLCCISIASKSFLGTHLCRGWKETFQRWIMIREREDRRKISHGNEREKCWRILQQVFIFCNVPLTFLRVFIGLLQLSKSSWWQNKTSNDLQLIAAVNIWIWDNYLSNVLKRDKDMRIQKYSWKNIILTKMWNYLILWKIIGTKI